MTIVEFASHHGASPRRAGTMDMATGRLGKVLLIVHRPETNPGKVGQWLRANGYQLDTRCPRFGDALPETLEEHAGVVVFGGPMSVNDPDDYIKQEIDWLAVPLREDKPYLGVCLGAQMLAKYLGAAVGFHNEGMVEVGYYPIRPTEAGRALMSWPEQVYQWHCEGFGIPSGADLIATGAAFQNQALRYGKAFGVQFHPEMTLAMIHRWTTVAAHRFAQPNAQGKRDHIAGYDAHDSGLRTWLGQFMSLWLAQGADGAVKAAANGYHQKGKKPSCDFSLGAGTGASASL